MDIQHRRSISYKKHNLLYLCWIILLTFLIGISVQPYYTPSGPQHIDKVLHCIGYFLIAFFPPLLYQTKGRLISFWFIFITAFATEGIQMLMPERSASVADVAANLSGLAIGWGLATFITALFHRPINDQNC